MGVTVKLGAVKRMAISLNRILNRNETSNEKYRKHKSIPILNKKIDFIYNNTLLRKSKKCNKTN